MLTSITAFLALAEKLYGLEVTQALLAAFKSKLSVLKLTPEQIAQLDANYDDLKARALKDRELAGG